MQCPECGVDVVEGAAFCHQCGASMAPADPDAAPQETAASDEPAPAPAAAPQPSPRERFTEGRRDDGDVPEEELWRGTYCGKAMIGWWVIGVLASIVLVVGGIYFWSTWYVGIISICLIPILWIYVYLLMFFRQMDVRYRLTTHRFFHESGILRRKQDLIEVIDIDDITCDQSLLERFVGVGSIHISSSDKTHPELTIYGIADAKQVSEIMERARHDERRRRGLHIEHI